MKSCLIIGGNGFIGKNLAAHLAGKGFLVTVVDHDIYGQNPLMPGVRYHVGSASDTVKLLELAADADSIVWLVHSTVPATSMIDIEGDLSTNITPLIRLVSALSQSRVSKKFLYLSSGGTIYGDVKPGVKIEEHFPKNPISSYGLTKLIAEEYLNFLNRGNLLQMAIFRPSNVYGPHQNFSKPQGILGYAFRAMLENRPLPVYGNGSIVRDYVYVGDIARAIELFLLAPITGSAPLTVNIGSGIGHSIREVLDEIKNVSGRALEIDWLPARHYDCEYNVLSFARAEQALGWRPTVDLRVGLGLLWKWIRKAQA